MKVKLCTRVKVEQKFGFMFGLDVNARIHHVCNKAVEMTNQTFTMIDLTTPNLKSTVVALI